MSFMDMSVSEVATVGGGSSAITVAGLWALQILRTWIKLQRKPDEPGPTETKHMPVPEGWNELRSDVKELKESVAKMSAKINDMHGTLPTPADLKDIGAERALRAVLDERIARALEALGRGG